MCNMSYIEQAELLAGPIGLLKMVSWVCTRGRGARPRLTPLGLDSQLCTKTAGEISDDAVQIFGGRGITQGGIGTFIEHFRRTQKVSLAESGCGSGRDGWDGRRAAPPFATVKGAR